MEDLYLYIAILATLAVLLIGLLYLKSQSGPSEKESKPARRRAAAVPHRDEDGQIVDTGPGPRGRRGGPRMRRRQVAEEPEPDLDRAQDEHDEEQLDSDNEERVRELPGKMGKKKLEKMQAKADKKLEREAELREREERKKRLEREEDERKKIEEKEKEDERKREEEEQRIREEKERKEHEEYLKLKEAFAVEEEGFDEDPEEDQENKLEVFIQYIKDNKVVVLEDLAAHFKLKTQDAIDRVTTLVEEEKLTGVIDDRGKFIYVSQEELEAVAKFISQRGRVSITELAENSNRLITLKTS